MIDDSCDRSKIIKYKPYQKMANGMFINGDYQDNEYQQDDCVICMEQFTKDCLIIRMPKCQHYFHPVCTVHWFKSPNQIESQLSHETNHIERRCPLCNQSMTIGDLIKEKQVRLDRQVEQEKSEIELALMMSRTSNMPLTGDFSIYSLGTSPNIKSTKKVNKIQKSK